MGILLDQYLTEKARTRKLAIFGAGKKSVVAEQLLLKNGFLEGDWIYFDNDRNKWGNREGKSILSPETISSDYLILISSTFVEEIINQLERKGLYFFDDWINAFEEDYIEAYIEHKNKMVPELSFSDLDKIEGKLREKGYLTKISLINENDFLRFERQLNFGGEYHAEINNRYRRKILEYYYAYNFLCLDNASTSYTYIDVGASGSPFAEWLRNNKKIRAFAVDLKHFRRSDLDYYIEADATHLPFEDETVDGISMQSSFECFCGNDIETKLIIEYARVLKKGGRIIILPLYMHNIFLSSLSPNFYGMGNVDEGAVECIRIDCGRGLQFARFYDIEALDQRVISVAEEYGLTVHIYSIPNQNVEIDGFVYLKFILELRKD